MGREGKGVCVNLLGPHFAHVSFRVVPRSLEEGAFKMRCPSDAGTPVLDRVLGVLVPLVLRSEGAVPPQPMLDMGLFGVWASTSLWTGLAPAPVAVGPRRLPAFAQKWKPLPSPYISDWVPFSSPPIFACTHTHTHRHTATNTTTNQHHARSFEAGQSSRADGHGCWRKPSPKGRGRPHTKQAHVQHWLGRNSALRAQYQQNQESEHAVQHRGTGIGWTPKLKAPSSKLRGLVQKATRAKRGPSKFTHTPFPPCPSQPHTSHQNQRYSWAKITRLKLFGDRPFGLGLRQHPWPSALDDCPASHESA